MSRVNQRLNGIDPLSYIGVDAYQPNDFIKQSRDPLTSDFNNFYLGTWWLNVSTNSLFYLASLVDGIATWVNVSSMSGAVTTLTANSGGQVGPTAGNINVLGDTTTMNIVGNPGTNTLTISAVGTGITGTLTGNSGGAVGPTAGNIDIIGTAPLAVAGNPGASTLTVSQGGSVADSFVTQSGTAVPSAGALTINGSNGLSTTGAGSTVTVVGGSSLSQSYITSPATGTAVPSAGVLTFAGAGGVTVSAAGSTVTINSSGSSPSYSAGTWTPVLAVGGSTAGITYSRQFGYYTQIGNVCYIQFDIALTGWSGAITGIQMTGLPFNYVNQPTTFGMATSQITFSSPASNALYTGANFYFWYLRFVNSGPASTTFPWVSAPSQSNSPTQGNYILSTTAFTGSGWYYIA